MKITELIAELEKTKQIEGDINVCFSCELSSAYYNAIEKLKILDCGYYKEINLSYPSLNPENYHKGKFVYIGG